MNDEAPMNYKTQDNRLLMVAPTITPIETVHNGYRFRSRLEARWSIFFETLGVSYEYEKEGYDLGEAGWYLPDFWIPYYWHKDPYPEGHPPVPGMWVEIKPVHPSRGEFAKLQALSSMTGHSAYLIAGNVGDEEFSVWKMWPRNQDARFLMQANFLFHLSKATPDQALFDFDENDGATTSAASRRAFIAARSARFERGAESCLAPSPTKSPASRAPAWPRGVAAGDSGAVICHEGVSTMNEEQVRQAMTVLQQQGKPTSQRNILQTLGFGSKRDAAHHLHNITDKTCDTYRNEQIMPTAVALPQNAWPYTFQLEEFRATIITKCLTVRPAMAAEWLSAGVPNRNMIKSKLLSYIQDMRNGKWALNGEPLLFNKEYQLMDGQHRLRACLETGISFETMAMFGVENEAMITIDSGGVRTGANVLEAVFRETNSNLLVAALKWVWLIDLGRAMQYRHNGMSFGRHLMLSILNSHPHVRKSLPRGSQAGRLLPKSFAVAAHYFMSQQDAPLADEYFNVLLGGENLQKEDSVYKLRHRLTQLIGDKRTQASPVYKAALVIKIWNDWRNGRRQRGIPRWSPDGEKAESFPVIR